MIAAAPVRMPARRKAILTVPLATRQRDIDREIDELDRGVHLAALLFILLGAAIGLSMAERIADPDPAADARDPADRARRLRRADRRHARPTSCGASSTHSTAWRPSSRRSATQLERTHRLEAWAEMARQVAHEIKNPLTPIQLSAEHLRRVHADRGEPLGAVLDGCVDVDPRPGPAPPPDLRRSSPASRRRPPRSRRPSTSPELVADVVDPYRTGLAGRIEIVDRVAGAAPPRLRGSHARRPRAREHRRKRAACDAGPAEVLTIDALRMPSS